MVAIPESITTMVSMDSGPAPSGASRNDGGDRARVHQRSILRPQLVDLRVARQIVRALAIDRVHHHALAVLQRGLADKRAKGRLVIDLAEADLAERRGHRQSLCG